MQKLGHNLPKTEQNAKMIFFETLGHLESEKLKLTKVRKNPDAFCKKTSDPDHAL